MERNCGVVSALCSLHLVVLAVVAGRKEVENRTVNVRTRDNTVHGEYSLDEVIERCRELVENRGLNSDTVWKTRC